MISDIKSENSPLELREQQNYEKILIFLKKAMQGEISRQKKEGVSQERLAGCINTFKEFLDYNNSLELLVNAHGQMFQDITRLCKLQGINLGESFLQELTKMRDFLASPRFDEFQRNAIPQSLHPLTQKILELPLLTPLAYRILNNYVLRRNEHEDITSMLSPESSHLNHYAFIRELRILLTFYTIYYLNRSASETQPAIMGIATAMEKLFGMPIEKTPVHQKMLLASDLYKSDLEFQEGLEMFQSQINQLKRLLQEKNISLNSPFVKYIFTLLDVDKKTGLTTILALLKSLKEKQTITEDNLLGIQTNLDIGIKLLDKSLSHYRQLLTSSETRSAISPELIEQIVTRIVSGSDFLNATRFIREIIQEFSEGAYDQHLYGTTLNILINKQTDFVKFDNFSEKQLEIEKSTQNREIVIAKSLKTILVKIMKKEIPPLPLPVLSATLFYFRFILGLIYKEKSRNHILTSQLDLIADGPSLPNNFTTFKRVKNSKTGEITFEPMAPAFEQLNLVYKTSASHLVDSCDMETNPDLVRNLQVWLFTQNVLK